MKRMTVKMAGDSLLHPRNIFQKAFLLVFITFGVVTSKHSDIKNMGSDIDTVHIIFMNHLDVGYNGIPNTGFINNIINIYFTEYFPRAIQLVKSLRTEKYEETFIYTTHPWLVSLYLDCPKLTLNNITLKCPNDDDIAAFKRAVFEGDITWHAGPMNMQIENMNKVVLELGLNISKNLDDMFGIRRKYPTLSQRDVPGMTAAAIPVLVSNGIAAVSVGVNPGTSPPAVPNPFLWSFQGQKMIGLWHKGGYPLNPGPKPANPGGLSRDDCVTVDNFTQALCFAFRTDNSGPPLNISEILSNYEILRSEFPGAKLQASTFDKFVEALQPVKDQLPVGEYEVGDTWIQGIASDPVKMAKYWAFAHMLDACYISGQCSGDDPRIQDAARYLIKPPEHTWGLPDVNDRVNWTNAAFTKAKTGTNYKNCETAWEEQRMFSDLALASLKDHPLAAMVKYEWQQQQPAKPDTTDYKLLSDKYQSIGCSDGTILQFTPDGSIQQLYDPYNKVNWASSSRLMGQIQYVTYNESDFDYMAARYDYLGGAGYDKPNSTVNAHPKSQAWEYSLVSLYQNKGNTCDLLLKLTPFSSEMSTYYGAPMEIWIQYVSRTKETPGLDVTVQFFDKTSTRLPESLSYSFVPNPAPSHNWYISKVGALINPGNVVLNGSQFVHATDSGVYFINNVDGSGLQLLSQDVPLVNVGTTSRRPSPFPVPLQPITQNEIEGMSFNFYNNIWNTNYILWYPYVQGDENFKARFKINFYKH